MTLSSIPWLAPLLVLCALAVTESGAAQQPAAPAPAASDTRELVVLVHGMGRSRASMFTMGRALEKSGYRVVNFGYPYRDSISGLGRRLGATLDRHTGAAPRVHFVTHSLGSILVRWVLVNHPPSVAGRVVMLAPPNQGSSAADRYARWIGWLLPPIHELRTDSTTTARTLVLPAGAEVGVIAGTRDGKVSVAESHLEGEREHVLVPSAHSFIMHRGDVRRLVLRFLATGTFAEARSGGESR
jgi:pimeloyl-ACP methyl ester carboxylesterase